VPVRHRDDAFPGGFSADVFLAQRGTLDEVKHGVTVTRRDEKFLISCEITLLEVSRSLFILLAKVCVKESFVHDESRCDE